MWFVANEGYRKNYNLFIIKIRKNNLKNGDEDVKQQSFTKIKICSTQTVTRTVQKPCI
jgi:hypothetical protein